MPAFCGRFWQVANLRLQQMGPVSCPDRGFWRRFSRMDKARVFRHEGTSVAARPEIDMMSIVNWLNINSLHLSPQQAWRLVDVDSLERARQP
jgi:hypothetical protein